MKPWKPDVFLVDCVKTIMPRALTEKFVAFVTANSRSNVAKHYPVGIYLLKVNNRNTRRRFGVFIVNFEHMSHLVLVFVLLTLNM